MVLFAIFKIKNAIISWIFIMEQKTKFKGGEIMGEPTIQPKGFECTACLGCAGCVTAAAYVVAVGGASFIYYGN